MAHGDTIPNDLFDCAVIGAGVVGCAMARAFALAGARVLVLEKAADILDGASKGNSGILHTGFDAPPGTLEQACIAEGYAEYRAVRERLNLPLLETSALVVAWSAEEDARLDALMDQARRNGVDDVHRVTTAELAAAEPHLARGAHGAFRVPGEHLIDPWSAPLAYLTQALANGGVLARGAEVIAGAFDGAAWTLETTRGPVRARTVVNCAGLYGDVVDERLVGRRLFSIRPRKGQFVVFDKAAAALVKAIVLPVPTEKTKGVVLCRTVWGNLLVGPTAEDQESRTDASTDAIALEALRRRAVEMVPALADMPITATYAGLRPATEAKDYRITHEAEKAYVSVGGIRSTGLSAALGIARHVLRLVEAAGAAYTPPADPAWPLVPTLAEGGERGWRRAGNGGIVCHCELVTRAEIEAALAGPLAARTLAGLKRRTRVTMGRCQGFYCLGALAEITEGRLDPPIAAPIAEGGRDRAA